MSDKINGFQDLVAWKEGHKLVLGTYKLSDGFPKSETFGLRSQITRAAVSITSNIAEGFSRNGIAEKIQFYHIALGSLTELQNQLIVAKDRSYISELAFEKIFIQSNFVHKLINGLIRSAKKFTPRTN